ncbi:MAG: hypothetical protein ABW125_20865, partial [Candidatus Thiodiazotropha lotti]
VIRNGNRGFDPAEPEFSLVLASYHSLITDDSQRLPDVCKIGKLWMGVLFIGAVYRCPVYH